MLITGIIKYGIGKGQISKDVDAEAISSCIITFIEGLIITAIASAVNKDMLRRQIDSFNIMLGIYLESSKLS